MVQALGIAIKSLVLVKRHSIIYSTLRPASQVQPNSVLGRLFLQSMTVALTLWRLGITVYSVSRPYTSRPDLPQSALSVLEISSFRSIPRISRFAVDTQKSF